MNKQHDKKHEKHGFPEVFSKCLRNVFEMFSGPELISELENTSGPELISGSELTPGPELVLQDSSPHRQTL